MQIKTLFSELNGFVVFDQESFLKFKIDNFKNNDILTPLIETDFGEVISKKGIAIPIVVAQPDDYGFVVSMNKLSYLNETLVSTTGWIINVKSKVCICGLGYLKKFIIDDLIENDKLLEYDIKSGWAEIEIHCGINNDLLPIIEIVIIPKENKPKFLGNLDIIYDF
ncbi:hypothetical protein [Lacinutrix salivirga]